MNNTCSICLERKLFCIKTPFRCKHSFHSSCIAKWNGDCPLCRATPKSQKYFHKIDEPRWLHNRPYSIEHLLKLYDWDDFECSSKLTYMK